MPIAVFDAKYNHNLWRPGEAIRNGDIDGNDASERDASWQPLIDAPRLPLQAVEFRPQVDVVWAVVVVDTVFVQNAE